MKITKEFWLSSVVEEPPSAFGPSRIRVNLFVPMFLGHIGEKSNFSFTLSKDAPELQCFENPLMRNEQVAEKLARLMGVRSGHKINRIFLVSLELLDSGDYEKSLESEKGSSEGTFVRLFERVESWLIPGFLTIRTYSAKFPSPFDDGERMFIPDLEIPLDESEYMALMQYQNKKYVSRIQFQEIPPEKSAGVREAIRIERQRTSAQGIFS